MVKVYFKNLISDNCQYKGCLLNENGRCLSDDTDFLWYLLEKLNEHWKEDFYFKCNKAFVPDGICEYCGSNMITETRGFEKVYYCKNDC